MRSSGQAPGAQAGAGVPYARLEETRRDPPPALRTNSEASDEGMLVLNAWNGPESAIIGPFLRSGTLPALFWRRCVARSEARSPPAGKSYR